MICEKCKMETITDEDSIKHDKVICDNCNPPLQPSKEECSCGCHTSKSSSEDMKKNGCDYCSFNHDEPSKE